MYLPCDLAATVGEKDTAAAGALERGAMAAAKLLLVRRIMRTRSAEVYSDDHLPTAFNALERGRHRGDYRGRNIIHIIPNSCAVLV